MKLLPLSTYSQAVNPRECGLRHEMPIPKGRVIYFVEGVGTGLVKIGLAKNFAARMVQVRCGSPCPLKLLAYIPEAGGDLYEMEYNIHSKFKHLHERGEWFRLTVEVREFLRLNAWTVDAMIPDAGMIQRQAPRSTVHPWRSEYPLPG